MPTNTGAPDMQPAQLLKLKRPCVLPPSGIPGLSIALWLLAAPWSGANLSLEGRAVPARMHQGAAPQEVAVFLNQGQGTNWLKQVVATTGSHEIQVADFNGDGRTSRMPITAASIKPWSFGSIAGSSGRCGLDQA